MEVTTVMEMEWTKGASIAGLVPGNITITTLGRSLSAVVMDSMFEASTSPPGQGQALVLSNREVEDSHTPSQLPIVAGKPPSQAYLACSDLKMMATRRKVQASDLKISRN